MITFDLDILRSVAKAATTELDYWRELFGVPDEEWRVTLGGVAVVLNTAIEAGVVQLVHAGEPSLRSVRDRSGPEQNGGGDEQSDPPGYMKGWKDGRESRERELELLNKTAQMDAYDRGYELGIAHGAASLDDAEHFDSDVLSNVREILGRWMQMLLALANDLDRAGETEGVAKLTTELMTIRSTFDLYEPLDDEADTPLSPDYDGGFYTQTPAESHDIDPHFGFTEEEWRALNPVPATDEPPIIIGANGHHAEPETAPPKDPYPGPPLGTARAGDEDDPPPPTVALIYKREPTDAEVAYGQKLARELEQVETISPAAAATPSVPFGTGLGPEHVVVTPLVPRRQPLAEDAPDFDYPPKPLSKMRSPLPSIADAEREDKAAELRAIVGLLQDMAVENNMPTMAEWDEGKGKYAGGDKLPNAAMACKRHRLTWGTFASYAKLDYKGRGAGKAN